MDTSILTRRIGPLPGWAWGGLVAVAAWWFFLRGRSATSSSSSGAGTAPNSNSVYGLGYAQGLQAAGANAPPPTATPAPGRRGVVKSTDPNYTGGAGIFSSPSTTGGTIAIVPQGTQLSVTGPPVTGQPWGGVDFWWPVDEGGRPGFISGSLFQVDQAGVGGAGGTARKHAVGSRSAWLHHDAHPLIGANVRYAHYVRAVGGPANHRREVHRVAQQSGVHPARIAMLNPEYTGRIRVA